MPLIYPIKGVSPSLGQNTFIAENATIVGDVVLGDNCSVWFNAVIRGDVHSIRIGNNVNIQDGAIIHCTYQKAAVSIGNNVSIAHAAIIHGCTIHDNVLVGMGAVVMDGVVVESNSIIAAGAVVSQNTLVESGSVYAGVPAKKIKSIDKSLLEGQVNRISKSYTMYASWHDDTIKPINEPEELKISGA
jgi:gamma-carbonic anhydrase